MIRVAEKYNVPVWEVITPWGLAQDHDFYTQMYGGIRYFDLRCGWDDTNKQWRTFHFEFGTPIETLLSQIAQFLADYTSEIVVIEASHLDGNPSDDDKRALASLILAHLGDVMYDREDNMAFTINSMV
jgi:hypothetical protein